MTRIFILLITIFILPKGIAAQTTYMWVGGNVGNYQDANNWSPNRTIPAINDILAFNAAFPITVANVPNQTIGAIEIASGTNSVTFLTNTATNVLSLSAAIPLVYLSAGSILAGDLLTLSLTNTASFPISSGTFGIAPSTGGKISISSDLVLNGGTLDLDVAGTGGTTILNGGSITYTLGTFNCLNANAVTWATGSEYFHNVDGSTSSSIPVSTWNNNSTCNITGMTAGNTAPSGLIGVIFSNLKWNCPSQFGDVDLNLGGRNVIINGTFTVASTGSKSLSLAGSGIANFTAGAYNQTGGVLILQSLNGSTTLAVNGSFSQASGTVMNFVSGGGGGIALLDLKGDVTKLAGSTWTSTGNNTLSQMTVQFSGSSSQAVAINGGWSASAGCFNISNTNTTGVIVTGTLQVINSNSTTAANCSLGGLFTGSGTIKYTGSGAGIDNFTLIYNGTIPQIASSVEFPATNGPANLTISNLAGTTFPASFSRVLKGTLKMSSGNLDLGPGNTLSLANSSLTTQLNYTAGFITGGTLKRYFPATSLPTTITTESRFPLGSGNNDRSIYIVFSSSAPAGAIADSIAVSQAAVANTSAISPSFIDNGSALNKRTNSNWTINTGAFNLGSGTISVLAQANNIGSVDNINSLRLTDAVGPFGILIPTTGTNETPLIGKSALILTDINGKTFYVGSDFQNALQIVTFTWTGNVNTDWSNTGNWTGGLGYPSSPTEIAIINTIGGNMPSIGTGLAPSVYQLTVGAPASLTMTGSGSITVYDTVRFTGTAIFSGTSIFTYASSNTPQNIIDLPYVNLAVSGTAVKTLPATTTVTGDFTISGTPPAFGNGTFVYNAGTAASQRVFATNYYNLTITGDRAGKTIWLGNAANFNTIDVANIFTMTATNYVSKDGGYNTINFSSPNPTTIPGFTYGAIGNSAPAGAQRTFDNLGSTDPAHMIICRNLGFVFPYVAGNYTTTGSKVKYNRNGFGLTLTGFNYYDLEITGDFAGNTLGFTGQIGIAGSFTVSAINYNLNTSAGKFWYNGIGNQTVTPFNYYDLWISGTAGASGTRTVTLPNGSTIGVRNQLAVTGPSSFTAGNGFIVTGSTVNFFTGSNTIPVLAPLVTGGNNYYNIIVSGGTRLISGDLRVGGDVSVNGTDANPAQLTIGNNVSNRFLTIAGNLSLTGTSSSSAITSIIDFNTVNRIVQIRLAGNLSISGTSQFLTGNDPLNIKGSVLFNGTNQQYSNTALYKNKYVNYIVGDGTSVTSLTLNNSIELTRSGVLPFSDTLTVANNATLNVGIKNIQIGIDTASGSNNAAFNLTAGATLITANTGGLPDKAIEGTATDSTNGTILASTQITKNYSVAANYVLNGATVNPFPAAISTMNNLTLGANVSLNKPIDVNGILDLASFVITQDKNDLEFSGLKSTIGSIYADKMSILTINGNIGTVDTLRFAPGGNSTGQLTINRPITVPLGSNLTIDNSPLTGNFITGTPSSILDINGNTLTINGTVSGTGFLSGSNTSNLTLGGAAVGTLNFINGKQVLKNLTLVNNATASLGTPLDITAGTGPGTEGTVSVTGSAILTSGGNLTLKSTANGTARVATGSGSGGYITGDVTVERFLSNHRSWRFLAAPTFGQTIKQSWQENQPAGVNPGAGMGTNITSNRATWLTDGFDFQTPGNSLLIYNPAANIWDGATSTNVPISGATANASYMLFLRGDRSATPAAGAPAITTTVMRTKGILFQGNLPPVIVNPGQYASIGNNYASAIDFTTLSKLNIDQSFSLWDPYVPGANNLGAWVTFSAATGWLPSISGVSYSGANTRIESGQAFMVHNNSGINGSITFNESDKISGSKLVSRPTGNNTAKQMLITNLYNTTGGASNITDGNFVVFSEDYSNAIDKWDAVKLNNFGDNFGISRNGQMLVVDARQPVAETDTIFFNMKKVKQQTYRLEFIANGFDASLMGFLEDNYLHTTTSVNMIGTTYYDFTVNGEEASASANRFRIVFKNSTPLPVTFLNIAAIEKVNGISVQWNVENETNIASYDVERSADGRNFTKMNNTASTGQNTGGSAGYNWLDLKAISGDNFYRIKSISKDGKTAYSKIVKVTLGNGKAGFTVYPNPVADGMIGLQMKNIQAGIYTIRIINSDGQLISKEIINHTGGSSTKTLTSARQLVSGSYQLEITGADNKVNMIRILVL